MKTFLNILGWIIKFSFIIFFIILADKLEAIKVLFIPPFFVFVVMIFFDFYFKEYFEKQKINDYPDFLNLDEF